MKHPIFHHRYAVIARTATVLCLLGVLIPSDPLRPQSANGTVLIEGIVVNQSGQPLSRTSVTIVQLEFTDCCGSESEVPTGADGAFRFDVPAAVYAITAIPPTPYNVTHLRVDARGGGVSGLSVQVKVEPSSFLPDDPPRASLIDISTPDSASQVTLTGNPGSVPPNGFVILVTLDTGHFTWRQSSEDGSFEASLFAPAGTSVLVKADPVGSTLRRTLQEAESGGEGSLAPLSGTIVRVPYPQVSGSGSSIDFSGAGLVGVGTVWTFEGTIESQTVAPGGTVGLQGLFEISSSLVEEAGVMEIHPKFLLERISGPDGFGSLARNVLASTLLTPTGLPIERYPVRSQDPFSEFQIVRLNKVAPDRAQATVESIIHVPDDLPDGYYRPLAFFFFDGIPAQETPDGRTLAVDELDLDNHEEMYLPLLRVGNPAAPRLYWTLLTDSLSNGSRGVTAVEDRERFALAPRILTQSQTFIIPGEDTASGQHFSYRLEPFVPTVSRGQQGAPPPPSLIPFRFPSGSLTVRIRKPDGSVDVLGPAPFLQSRMRSLVDRSGKLLDHGGGHLTDVYQLSTMEPQFEVEFRQQGRHVITLEGSVEDIWGNVWAGGGTYDVYVARLLSLDTTALPGTPLEVGDTFNSGMVLHPPVSADVELHFQLAPDSDARRLVSRVVRGRANRFGYLQADMGDISLEMPGEYRVDVVASYRDDQGQLWMGSRTWGSAVAPENTNIIAHGRRGIDDQPLGPHWFVRTETGSLIGSTHVFLPFHSGDISWQQESDAVLPEITLQDPGGTLLELLRSRTQELPRFADFEERALAGETPLFSSRADGLDPHLDPEKVDLWGYSYKSVQRPLVRVREELTGHERVLQSLYWRFNAHYAAQFGVGANGDLPNDIKFQFGAAVLRGSALAQPEYGIYGSLFVLVPDDDPLGGTRTFPPFQGAAGGPSGGPIMTLRGREIDIFFHPTGIRPGSVLELGDIASFAGQVGPTLPSKVEITVTTPGGEVEEISGQANKIGYFYEPATDFIVEEPGPYRVKVTVWHDGLTSAGAVQPPFPTGDVLGSREGEFLFYVVGPDSTELEVDIPRDSFVRAAEGPISILLTFAEATLTRGEGSQLEGRELFFTTVMPGFILEEGTTTGLSYTYDAPRLNQDFPNLDLFDADGRSGVDTVTMSFLLSGPNGEGEKVYQARQALLQGEELLALPHRLPVEGFAQFGNGQGLTSTLILVNPSSRQTARGTACLTPTGTHCRWRPTARSRKGAFPSRWLLLQPGFLRRTAAGP